MKDQHTKIKGYRDLTADEIELMNQIKAKGEELGELVDRMDRHTNPDRRAAEPGEFLDGRWISIGRTHLQQGIMALVRAVAQPTTF